MLRLRLPLEDIAIPPIEQKVPLIFYTFVPALPGAFCTKARFCRNHCDPPTVIVGTKVPMIEPSCIWVVPMFLRIPT